MSSISFQIVGREVNRVLIYIFFCLASKVTAFMNLKIKISEQKKFQVLVVFFVRWAKKMGGFRRSFQVPELILAGRCSNSSFGTRFGQKGAIGMLIEVPIEPLIEKTSYLRYLDTFSFHTVANPYWAAFLSHVSNSLEAFCS